MWIEKPIEDVDQIEQMIRWYEEHGTNPEHVVIMKKLKMIKSLLREIKDPGDRVFVNEIIDSFAKIVSTQQKMLEDMELLEKWREWKFCEGEPDRLADDEICFQPGGLQNDQQVHAAFTAYLTGQAKKPLSSYTINDYCSRVRNLWKQFYQDQCKQDLPEELIVPEERIKADCPLLNAYHHIEQLHCYASMVSVLSEEKRNWANACAALNKFLEFVYHTKQNQ